MSAWIERILEEFPESGPLVSRVTVARDPDAVLADDAVLEELSRRGYRTVAFEDALGVRYHWENEIRNELGRRLVIAIRGGENPETAVPWDLRAQCGREPDFSLESLFPSLDASVLRGLDRRHLAEVYENRYLAGGAKPGWRGTCEFVFERILGISPSAVSSVPAFFIAMHRIHFGLGISSRTMLDYVRDEVCGKREFPAEAYGELITNPSAFLAKIQDDWNVYLAMRKERGALQVRPEAGLPLVPFDDPGVRSAVSDLLRKGLLHGDGTVEGLRIGLDYAGDSAGAGPDDLMAPFFAAAEARLDGMRTHTDWLSFAREWAEIENIALSHGGAARLNALRDEINRRFLDWLRANFAGLSTIPGRKAPVMVHRTVQTLARYVREGDSVALVVVDGLALHQWAAVRDALPKTLSFDEGVSFAWIPTLTSVSRQAIFSGKAPYGFASSFETTNAEKKEWKTAWAEECPELAPDAVHYERALGKTVEPAAGALSRIPGAARICGLVVNGVDDILHGETMGSENCLRQIRSWAESGYLGELLEGLLERGFKVVLTSDHGNIGVVGTGTISEGVIADTKGERVRMYSDVALRGDSARRHPEAFAWIDAGLPDGRFALLAHDNGAFLKEGTTAVSHGGASIEEVVVPFVMISRK